MILSKFEQVFQLLDAAWCVFYLCYIAYSHRWCIIIVIDCLSYYVQMLCRMYLVMRQESGKTM